MIRPHLNYGQKLFLTATLPLILAMVTISVLVTLQSRQMAEREIHSLEEKLIAAKRDELKNYLSLARPRSSTYMAARHRTTRPPSLKSRRSFPP